MAEEKKENSPAVIAILSVINFFLGVLLMDIIRRYGLLEEPSNNQILLLFVGVTYVLICLLVSVKIISKRLLSLRDRE